MLLVHFCCSFKETRVQIKHISRISLTTRRSSQKKRHLSIGDGLFWQVVINNKSVLSIVSEVLSNSTTSIRGQELKRSSFWCCSSHNDGISKSIMILKYFHNICDSWSLLTNSNVNAIKSLSIIRGRIVEGCFLVNNGINSNSGLASLSVSNNKLSLTSTNRYLCK